MAQEDELPPPEKKKSKLKWIIMILLVLLLGGGGAAAYFLGFLDGFIGKGEDGEVQSKQTQGVGLITPTITLPSFLVNLYDPLGRRYIKLDVELELISPEVKREVELLNARIRDAMILLLSSKTYSELSTPEGKHILRNEIMDRVNQILNGPKVVRVYFTDFVIQ